ncbi:hypothetical protein HG263_04680 [Pseudoalteromonas sp. JBTF-M23]|uniref:Uncharacterized protein n=1 Tax=Pseudoalteromonas caenipelagi TaxID=2726988 RepID=A0A849V8E0_9GAMM|nr:hypothetical protein [Pseudoalteromonas caenipelagi]NOU49829.1 hypothetical protein [Pseudoalteromonas caenipelagi]
MVKVIILWLITIFFTAPLMAKGLDGIDEYIDISLIETQGSGAAYIKLPKIYEDYEFYRLTTILNKTGSRMSVINNVVSVEGFVESELWYDKGIEHNIELYVEYRNFSGCKKSVSEKYIEELNAVKKCEKLSKTLKLANVGKHSNEN